MLLLVKETRRVIDPSLIKCLTIVIELGLKDLLPDIITHMGPKQMGELGKLLKKPAGEGIKESTAEEEEDVPSLVNQDFEQASKK